MDSRFIIMVIFIGLIELSCDNDKSLNNKNHQNVTDSVPEISSFLMERVYTFKVNKLSNVDSLNGFRDLKLGLPKSSINLEDGSTYQTIENPFGITFCELYSDVKFDSIKYPCRFNLCFINDTLSQISLIFDREYKEILNGTNYFPITLEDMETVFSKNRNYQYKTKGLIPGNAFTGKSRPAIEDNMYTWIGNKVVLEYSITDFYTDLEEYGVNKTDTRLTLSYKLKDEISVFDKYEEFLLEKHRLEDSQRVEQEKTNKSKSF